MATVALRDLRNHTAEVLRQVSGGTTVTVNGRPVAAISPIRSARSQFLSKADVVAMVAHRQADPALGRELDLLAGETTEDLDLW